MPGMRPDKILRLHSELGITFDGLEQACRDGRLAIFNINFVKSWPLGLFGFKALTIARFASTSDQGYPLMPAHRAHSINICLVG